MFFFCLVSFGLVVFVVVFVVFVSFVCLLVGLFIAIVAPCVCVDLTGPHLIFAKRCQTRLKYCICSQDPSRAIRK